LARNYWEVTSTRWESDRLGIQRRAQAPDADRQVVERVGEIARARGVPMASVALAWMLSKPMITAPIIGATKLAHLDEAVQAVEVKLGPEEIASLEAPYVPHIGPGQYLRLPT
jgi:aryl-alcohol dehydrogenase-like predicted oxidoreductase